jgi:hypothetical protein
MKRVRCVVGDRLAADNHRMSTLLTLLRDRPKVTIHSPLSPEETLRRLHTGLLGEPVSSLDTGREKVGRRVVVGRVYGDRVRVHTRGVSSQNTQKILRARCVPTVDGCDIVGTFALRPVAESLLFVVGLGSMAGFGWSVVQVFTGTAWHTPALWAAVSLGVFVVAAALVCLDRLVEDRDERFIKAWIERRLVSAPEARKG